jgi:hypothetical protein
MNNNSLEKTNKSINNSPVSLKRLKTDYSLPKVGDGVKDSSERDKLTITSNSMKESDVYGFIYNTFQSKLTSEGNLADNLIKAFDYLATNADNKFKNLSDFIKSHNPTSKVNTEAIDSLNEQNIKLRNELELTKSQLGKKDVLVQSYLDKIKEQELNITKLKSKIQSVREMKEENKQLKDYVKDLKSEVEFLREKEGKLMKVIFSIHKKGIAIDELLTSSDIQHDTSDISTTTYYFPDKVHMENKQGGGGVPRLDFNTLSDFEAKDAREAAAQQKPAVDNAVKKKSGIKDFQHEFMQNYDEFSESWRNEVKQMKNYKDLFKKKK